MKYDVENIGTDDDLKHMRIENEQLNSCFQTFEQDNLRISFHSNKQ